MADNVTSQAVTTPGAVFAADDIAGVYHPRVKIQIGADGAATDVSSTNPVPVRLNDGSANLDIATLDLDSGAGTVTRVAVGLALPGAGGPVAGGTSANPVRVDPTGTTPQLVKGTTAHDAAASAEPLLVAYRANIWPNPAAVSANNDVVYALGDLQGRGVVTLNSSMSEQGNGAGPVVVDITNAGDNTILAAPGAGFAYCVTEILLSNTDGAVATIATVLNGAGAGQPGMKAYLAALGGQARMAYNPPWQLTEDTALVVNLSAAPDVSVTVHYFIIPV